MGYSSTTTTSHVTLAQLCRAPEFQVRKRLDQNTVNRYASAIKAGQQLPPLQVALVDNVPCLVDGYHRAAALEALGYLEVEATITPTTRDEALWMAASANLTHGLPLKSSEVRAAFRVYIQTKQHRKGKGRLKSFREMAQELGRSHNTIRNWMTEDFPRLAKEYGGHQPGGDGGLQPQPPQPPAAAQDAISYLEQARQAFQATSCPVAREAIRLQLKALHDELMADWQKPLEDF